VARLDESRSTTATTSPFMMYYADDKPTECQRASRKMERGGYSWGRDGTEVFSNVVATYTGLSSWKKGTGVCVCERGGGARGFWTHLTTPPQTSSTHNQRAAAEEGATGDEMRRNMRECGEEKVRGVRRVCSIFGFSYQKHQILHQWLRVYWIKIWAQISPNPSHCIN
jgi:hypothetical protein